MTIEQFGILLTLIATILGWFYTNKKQREILDVTRQHDVADREISATRESMAVIREVNESLHSISFELRWLGQAKEVHIQHDELWALVRRTQEKMSQFQTLMTDANYVWLRKQLPEEDVKRVDAANDGVREVVESLAEKIETENLSNEQIGREAPEWTNKMADAFDALAVAISEAFADYLVSVVEED